MKSPFIQTNPKTWEPMPGDLYEVTGVTTDGRRFKMTSTNWAQARAINLWRGAKWLRRNGRRWKLVETWNG